MLCMLAQLTQGKLGVSSECEPPGTLLVICQFQYRNTNGVLSRHPNHQPGCQTVMIVHVCGRARAVFHRVGRIAPNRSRRGTPELATVIILYVDHVRWLVTHWIISPRSEPVKIAAAGPRHPHTTFCRYAAAFGVGNDVGPRGRRHEIAVYVHSVVSVLGQTTIAIVECKPLCA